MTIQRLESLLEQAAKKEPSYADFLLDLLKSELEARRNRYLRARLQLAHLPYVKTFDQFDFSFQPSVNARDLLERFSAEPLPDFRERIFCALVSRNRGGQLRSQNAILRRQVFALK